MILDGIRWRLQPSMTFRYNETPYIDFVRKGKVIPVTGHSLTNMAYGADGRAYLAWNGRVYASPKRA